MVQNSDGYVDVKRYTNQQIAAAAAGGQSLEAAFGRNGGKHYYLHRIGYVAFHGQNLVDQASHICDTPNCIRGNHIADETGQVNNSRSNCRGSGLLDDRNHLMPVTAGQECRHQPKCFPSRMFLLACPHPFATSVWSVPQSHQVRIDQWIQGANLTAPAPPPPPVVQQASQDGLFSDEFTPDDDRSSPAIMPSSPPLGWQAQFAQAPSSGPAVPNLDMPPPASSSRPGSSSSSLPHRPAPRVFPAEIPDSEMESSDT